MRACFHHRAEGRAQRRRRVGEAFRVRTAHRHVVALGDGADSSCRRERRRRRAPRRSPSSGWSPARMPAAPQRSSSSGTNFAGMISTARSAGAGSVGDRAEGRETLHLGFAAAHRIDRSGERVAFHDQQDAAAQALGIGRGADDRHRARPQQFSDIGHEISPDATALCRCSRASAQAEAARDDAAQHLRGAALDGELGRDHGGEGELLLECGAIGRFGLEESGQLAHARRAASAPRWCPGP